MGSPKPKAKRKHPPPLKGPTALHVPTSEKRKEVAMLVGLGAKKEFIAEHLGIAKSTLEKHYQAEIRRGRDTANVQVANHMFQLTKKNVAAGVFWLVNRDGDNWRHVQHVTHEAGKGFDLEKIVARSLGKGDSNASAHDKKRGKAKD